MSELFSLYKTRIWMQQVDIAIDGDDSPGTRLAKKVGLLSSFPCEDSVLNGNPWLGYAPQQQQQQHSKDNYTAEAQQLWQDQNLA